MVLTEEIAKMGKEDTTGPETGEAKEVWKMEETTGLAMVSN